MEREITIEDVAKMAGVSRATAGRAIGNYGSISQEAKQKVIAAVKQLNYQPNVMAQGLRGHNSKTIAIILGSIKNNYCNGLAYVVEKEAQKVGYSVIICNTLENKDKEVMHLQNMKSRKVDGIILMSSFRNDEEIPEQYKKLYENDLPIVFVDRKIRGVNRDTIMTNNVEMSYEAASYLIGLGHKKIGIIATTDFSTVRERIDGYKKALEDNQIIFHMEYIKRIEGFDKEEIEKVTADLLNEYPEITAIYVLNNSLCSGVLLELKKRHLKLKKDLSLIVWDDEDLNQLYDITSIIQPIPEIGKQATKKLFDLIKGVEVPEIKVKQLKARMIIRDSCNKIN